MRGGLFWLAVAATLGGIVHLAAMLVIPSLAPKSAYSRFEASIEPNRATVMGPALPDDPAFPFASPDLVYVLCRYDVAERPLRFVASLPNTYWSLGLFEPDGGNFYHTNSMQSPTGQPDLVLVGRGQELETGTDLAVTEATSPRGLIMLRIFLRDRTLAPTMKRAAANASCAGFDIG